MAASLPGFLPPPMAGLRAGSGALRHAAAATAPTGGGVPLFHRRLDTVGGGGGGGVLLQRRWAPLRQRRGGGLTMAAAAEGGATAGGGGGAADAPSTPAPLDMDATFARLGHKNEVMRKRVRYEGGVAQCERESVGVERLWWPCSMC